MLPVEEEPAQLLETHTSVVVLVGDRAYKVKKSVDLGFLDFSTPDKRHRACARELALNRRMAPDVYLGVGRVEQPGRAAETAVVMRRMPAERRLSTMVAAHRPVSAALRSLARDLSTLHAASPGRPDLRHHANLAALRARWRDSIADVRELGVLAPADVDEVATAVEQFLDGREELFDQRVRDGFVVDGHGDLLADDIFCLPEGPRAIDCLEFDDALRHVDGLDDAAFLAMDLERLGAPHLATMFLDAYVAYRGDLAPPSLRHHYIAYRAFVRAKVCCLRAAQRGATTSADAQDFVTVALRHLRRGAVRLVLVGGLPGTGKTTLAGLLADRHGSTLLSSDRIRKELAGLPPDRPAPAAFGEGIYTAETTDATYAELERRAGLLLARGESVVLDASWTSARRRSAATRLAQHASAELIELRCVLSADIAAERMRSRGAGSSDADELIAARLAAVPCDWPTATVVDTTAGRDSMLDQAEARFLPPDASRSPRGEVPDQPGTARGSEHADPR